MLNKECLLSLFAVPIYSFPTGPIFAPVRARAPAPTHQKQVKCRFFPNCTDMNCAFAHPKVSSTVVHCSIKCLLWNKLFRGAVSMTAMGIVIVIATQRFRGTPNPSQCYQ